MNDSRSQIQQECAASIDGWRRALRYSKNDIANRLGISYSGASKKLAGINPFKASEVQLLCTWWGLTFEELSNFGDYEGRIRLNLQILPKEE